jgi:hypothetical protein
MSAIISQHERRLLAHTPEEGGVALTGWRATWRLEELAQAATTPHRSGPGRV